MDFTPEDWAHPSTRDEYLGPRNRQRRRGLPVRRHACMSAESRKAHCSVRSHKAGASERDDPGDKATNL